MKSVCALLATLFVFAGSSEASAQMFDVRAYSRQRGFKAYQVKEPVAQKPEKQRKRPAEKQDKKREHIEKNDFPADKKSEGESLQTDEMCEYIKNNPQVQPDV